MIQSAHNEEYAALRQKMKKVTFKNSCQPKILSVCSAARIKQAAELCPQGERRTSVALQGAEQGSKKGRNSVSLVYLIKVD